MNTATKPINIDKLAQEYNKASDAYYNGTPVMSDADFDALKDKIEKLDPDNSCLNQVGAPVPTDGWPTHVHKSFMGSLKKIAPDPDDPDKQRREWFKWSDDKGDSFLLSLKYDGSTVVATYKDGELITLATRGNGEKGENITPNAMDIGVPPMIQHPQHSKFTGEIRGEAMLLISVFEKHCAPLGHRNPRNTAAGKTRSMKDDPLKKHIDVFWFDVISENVDLKTEEAKWQFLADAGMEPNPPTAMDATEVWETFKRYRESGRAALNFEIDGLVAKINDLTLQESFGVVKGCPKGAMAFKFPHVEKDTTVVDIEWGRGLTGNYTPVGILDPINIGGVTITRVSLCGIEEIKRLDLAIGDRVVVSRRNDVIPKVERVLQRNTTRDTKQPTKCVECDEKLVRNGAYILCMNADCQGEIYGNLMTWIREHQIKGIGPSILRGLIEQGITDIYGLYMAQIADYAIASGSEKTGLKRHNAVQASRKMRLSSFLSALNIRALGTTNGQRLEKKFKSIDGVLAASIEDLQEVPGIKTNAKKIHKGLIGAAALIASLRSILEITDLDDSGSLAGKSFCVTGELSLPREDLHDWIRNNGGEIKSGVSKTTGYLVTNTPDSGTGKNKKADKYGCPKITEDQLYELAGNRP